MAISPNMQEDMALLIRRMYEDAEIQLLQKIAARLVRDGDAPDWMMAKLAQMTPLVREINSIMVLVNRTVPKEIEKVIELAYISGNQSVVDDLLAVLAMMEEDETDIADNPDLNNAIGPFPPGTPISQVIATVESMGGVNTGAVEALAAAATGQLVDKHVPIVRAAQDIYREIILEVGANPLIGTETRIQATQRALNKFADKGIKTFVDRRGNSWDMARYSEMAVRTMIGQASLQGHADQQQSFGMDLVQVSDHAEECPLCRPWEGKILSLSGNHPRYKSLAEARAAGLFHTYCGHRANTYIAGYTKPLKKTKDPAGYEEKQKQRALERGIRKWKRRAAVAVTPEEKQLAAAKLTEWRGAMDQFIEDTGRVRKRAREQITKAR